MPVPRRRVADSLRESGNDDGGGRVVVYAALGV